MNRFYSNNLHCSTDLVLRCVSSDRLKGNRKSDGQPFDVYSSEFREVMSDKSIYDMTNVIDGDNPPVPGQEYPVICQIQIRQGQINNVSLVFDPNYVS